MVDMWKWILDEKNQRKITNSWQRTCLSLDIESRIQVSVAYPITPLAITCSALGRLSKRWGEEILNSLHKSSLLDKETGHSKCGDNQWESLDAVHFPLYTVMILIIQNVEVVTSSCA